MEKSNIDNMLFNDFVSDEERKLALPVIKEFISVYSANPDKPANELLIPLIKSYLPDMYDEEVNEIVEKILLSFNSFNATKVSFDKAPHDKKEEWFENKVIQGLSAFTARERAEYLVGLDNCLKEANSALELTIKTKASGYKTISQNPNLDGYIAEIEQVASFNMDAAAKGSTLHAEIQPMKQGETYSKNGFDVIIKDGSGKRIHQYQLKYGKTAGDTIRMLKAGNYNNQIIVVPQEQVEAVQKAFPNKTVTSVIGDGNIHSKPLTKQDVKSLQNKALEEGKLEIEWAEFDTKAVIQRIGIEAGFAMLQGAAISVGSEALKKMWNEERIEADHLIEVAIISGADMGLKVIVAGALKVCSEKGYITFIPKGTSSNIISNIVYVAFENLKIIGKVITGTISLREGARAMEETSLTLIAGYFAMEQGKIIGLEIGEAIGISYGPVGAFVGGIIGMFLGTVVTTGYFAIKNAVINTQKSIEEMQNLYLYHLSNLYDEALEQISLAREEMYFVLRQAEKQLEVSKTGLLYVNEAIQTDDFDMIVKGINLMNSVTKTKAYFQDISEVELFMSQEKRVFRI